MVVNAQFSALSYYKYISGFVWSTHGISLLNWVSFEKVCHYFFPQFSFSTFGNEDSYSIFYFSMFTPFVPFIKLELIWTIKNSV